MFQQRVFAAGRPIAHADARGIGRRANGSRDDWPTTPRHRRPPDRRTDGPTTPLRSANCRRCRRALAAAAAEYLIRRHRDMVGAPRNCNFKSPGAMTTLNYGPPGVPRRPSCPRKVPRRIRGVPRRRHGHGRSPEVPRRPSCPRKVPRRIRGIPRRRRGHGRSPEVPRSPQKAVVSTEGPQKAVVTLRRTCRVPRRSPCPQKVPRRSPEGHSDPGRSPEGHAVSLEGVVAMEGSQKSTEGRYVLRKVPRRTRRVLRRPLCPQKVPRRP